MLLCYTSAIRIVMYAAANRLIVCLCAYALRPCGAPRSESNTWMLFRHWLAVVWLEKTRVDARLFAGHALSSVKLVVPSDSTSSIKRPVVWDSYLRQVRLNMQDVMRTEGKEARGQFSATSVSRSRFRFRGAIGCNEEEIPFLMA